MTTIHVIPGIVALVACSMMAQSRPLRGPIDRLKATTVSKLEPGLPNERFDRWFADLVQPSRPEYELNDCGERNGTPDERGKEFPMCATAKATVGDRAVELSFVVGTYVVPVAGDKERPQKPSAISLFSGSVGPSNPQNKQPTRTVRKLSELKQMLHPEVSPSRPHS